MNITHDNNGTENAVENTNEKAPNVAETEEQSDTAMLEDTNSNANPPA